MAEFNITCPNCGKVLKPKRRYCSRYCLRGPFHHRWNGGTNRGYVLNRSTSGTGSGFVHVQIAERALGHPLPPKARVHHIDGDGTNNAHNNLVICENQAYHMLLHFRQRVIAAGGNPYTDKVCNSCGIAKPKTEFYARRDRPGGLQRVCRKCSSDYCRAYSHAKHR